MVACFADPIFSPLKTECSLHVGRGCRGRRPLRNANRIRTDERGHAVAPYPPIVRVFNEAAPVTGTVIV
jgi:hypothetical protein